MQLVNKHMKRSSIFVIREMEIKVPGDIASYLPGWLEWKRQLISIGGMWRREALPMEIERATTLENTMVVP